MQKGDTAALNELIEQDSLVRLFTDLISFDTRAELSSQDRPSSIGQLRLGAYILKRLSSLKLNPVQSAEGVISVRIPASAGCEKSKKLCLSAHLDTAPDAAGDNIKPALVRNYAGEGIELANGLITDRNISPELSSHIGEDIIVTDGNTLLGADDKAGVAVILQIIEDCVSNRIPHGPLYCVFSTDEEIGRSFSYLNIKDIDCDFAVTVDGCEVGELDVATFNAEGVRVTFEGRSVHTAVAYGKLRNAVSMCSEFICALPENERPEKSRDEEGFYHVHDIKGSVASAELRMILRDFSKEGLRQKHEFIESLVRSFCDRYGENSVQALFVRQYENMEDYLKKSPDILNHCRKAFAAAGVPVKEKKVRGGTDGAALSAAGLPCPNIFTGALNCHGPYECLPVKSLHSCFDVVKALVESVASDAS